MHSAVLMIKFWFWNDEQAFGFAGYHSNINDNAVLQLFSHTCTYVNIYVVVLREHTFQEFSYKTWNQHNLLLPYLVSLLNLTRSISRIGTMARASHF